MRPSGGRGSSGKPRAIANIQTDSFAVFLPLALRHAPVAFLTGSPQHARLHTGNRDMTAKDHAQLTLPVNPRDHIIGPEDAPATLVEYGDYECPRCAAAYPVIEELLQRWGD